MIISLATARSPIVKTVKIFLLSALLISYTSNSYSSFTREEDEEQLRFYMDMTKQLRKHEKSCWNALDLTLADLAYGTGSPLLVNLLVLLCGAAAGPIGAGVAAGGLIIKKIGCVAKKQFQIRRQKKLDTTIAKMAIQWKNHKKRLKVQPTKMLRTINEKERELKIKFKVECKTDLYSVHRFSTDEAHNVILVELVFEEAAMKMNNRHYTINKTRTSRLKLSVSFTKEFDFKDANEMDLFDNIVVDALVRHLISAKSNRRLHTINPCQGVMVTVVEKEGYFDVSSATNSILSSIPSTNSELESFTSTVTELVQDIGEQSAAGCGESYMSPDDAYDSYTDESENGRKLNTRRHRKRSIRVNVPRLELGEGLQRFQ